MSTFKVRKIRHSEKSLLMQKIKQNLITALGIILIIFVIYSAGSQLLAKLSGTRIAQVLSTIAGKGLIQDKEGHTNILLIGVGGEGHEGKDLTDSIIVASLNQTTKLIHLLSIPRDLYIESSLGGSRVNRLYEKGKIKWGIIQGLDFIKASLEKILAIPLHYVVKVDFEAFEKIIDSIGGVDIFVEENINDPLYPRDGTYEYEPFFLSKGNQHLDGKTALKYIRSRKSSSDFNRSHRQHQVLLAFINKAKEEGLSYRKSFLRNLFFALQNHVETTLSLREILSFAEFGANWNSKNLFSAALNDEPTFRGGFLYTPLRELYGGAFVLLPAGDSFDSLQLFIQLFLYGPKGWNETPIVILNGTKETGLAGKTKNILERFGIPVLGIGNTAKQPLENTKWYYRNPEINTILPSLQKIIPGSADMRIPEESLKNPKWAEAKIILELGKNSLPVIEKLDIFKNIIPLTE